MTSQGNGKPDRYTVRTSKQTKAILQQLYTQAVQAGTVQRFMTALRQIGIQLQTDPLTFGEPQYGLPALKLLVRQAVVSPLVVDYAVHEDRPLVFVHGFKVLS